MKNRKNYVYRITDAFSLVLLAVLFIFSFLQVVSRFVFNDPIVWSEEMARLTLVWITFVAAAVVELETGHVRFELLDDMLPPKGKLVLDCVLYLFSTAFLVITAYYGVKMTIAGHKITSVSLDFVRWSYVYISVPLGFLVMEYSITKKLINSFRAVKGTMPNQRNDFGEEGE